MTEWDIRLWRWPPDLSGAALKSRHEHAPSQVGTSPDMTLMSLGFKITPHYQYQDQDGFTYVNINLQLNLQILFWLMI